MTEPIRTYTVSEVAQILHVCRRTVFYLFRSGDLKRVKVRARTLVRESDLRRFLDRAPSH